MNVIDVGANIGYFTALAARSVAPGGRVLAVEADPETFCLLRANVELNRFAHVELLPVAAHRIAGLVTGARDPENHGGHTAYVASKTWTTIPMQAVRLDDVLDPEAPVHFIKVDIEGMDHAAVEGLEQTIRRWRPILLVEFFPEKIAWFGDKPEDALHLYRTLGLEISVLGWDALRLRDETGLDLDEFTRNGLVMSPECDTEFTERTSRIGLINLILTPRPGWSRGD
jgi:FkbM family methyltransferase